MRTNKTQTMKKLRIKLENCYGIRRLDCEFDLSDCRHVAIYASNGTMKTSLAKTFKDVSKGDESQDRIFDRPSMRTITKENDEEVQQDGVLVIESQANTDDMPAASSEILANKELRDEYNAISMSLKSGIDGIIKDLSKLSGLTKTNTGNSILEDFGVGGGYESIFAVFQEYVETTLDPSDDLSDVRYADVLGEKVWAALEQGGVKQMLRAYLQKYNELVSKSPYLSTTFDHSKAQTVNQKLSTTGFFKAEHSVSLKSKNENSRREIISEEAFKKFVAEEEDRIEAKMIPGWKQIDDKLSFNIELQRFRSRMITDRGRLLNLLLNDHKRLRKLLWFSYFTKTDQTLRDLLDSYKLQKNVHDRLVKKANEEKTDWDDVVNVFKKRFSVPFNVLVTNRPGAILEGEIPTLEFRFCDAGHKKTMMMAELDLTVSAGESRAVYILNMLFKIMKKIKERKETIIVLDDIVDSFDYANKYAIIQYLKEISENEFFYLIILTHNFDFFRAVMDRHVVEYKRCYYVNKTNGRVSLKNAHDIRTLLRDIVQHERSGIESDKRFVAAITFARNIVEYTRGKECTDYKRLSSLLHWQPDMPKILVCDIQETLCDIIPQMKPRRRGDLRPVYEFIMETARRCTGSANDLLYNKIVLSIAIRIQVERFILCQPNLCRDPPFDSTNTHCLIKRCKKLRLPEPVIDILDEVGIMIPSIIHLNAFMYEPIVDIDHTRLRRLFGKVCELPVRDHTQEAAYSTAAVVGSKVAAPVGCVDSTDAQQTTLEPFLPRLPAMNS